MKILLILLLSLSLYADNYLLLSGFAYHGKKDNNQGREYDKVIEGIGYQYNSKNYTLSAMYLQDSNREHLGTATIGSTYGLTKNIGIGGEIGVASQMIIYEDHKERVTHLLIFPKIEIISNGYMMNLAYFPKMTYGEYSTDYVLYMNFGIKF